MSDKKLHVLYDSNSTNIPASMEALVKDIRSGSRSDVIMCNVVTMDSDGVVEVFGLGDNDIFKAISLLDLGKVRLVAEMLGMHP